MEPRGMRRYMGSLRRDPSIKNSHIGSGTFKRVLKFAAPYKKLLIIFLVMIILDAAIGVVNPLIYREIIDKGIIAKNTSLIVHLAFLIAALAVTDACISFVQ